MPIDPLLHSFAYGVDFLCDQVQSVSPADMVAQPPGIANHPVWVIGHITFTCQMIGGVIGLEPWLPDDFATRFGPGSVPVADVNAYPSKHEMLAAIAQAKERITKAVASLTSGQLDAPFPDPSYRDVFPTIRHALTQVLVGHAAYHIGQVGSWRRAMGLPAMARSFE